MKEEQELAILVEQGDLEAKQRLAGNLRLVVSIAKRVTLVVVILDLIQEGNMGDEGR